LAVLRKLEAIPKPTRAALRQWLDEYFSMWQKQHLLCEAYWEAAAADPQINANAWRNGLNTTALLTEFLARFPDSRRERVQLRLTFLVIAMDRIAHLVDIESSSSQTSRILDEFADILWYALFGEG